MKSAPVSTEVQFYRGELEQIDALAIEYNMSRNKMFHLLLKIGLKHLYDYLDDIRVTL